MTLDERVIDLARHNINISRANLRTLYLKNGIRYQRVNIWSTYKTRAAAEIQRLQMHYVQQLTILEN
jgi:hypothetical protein